MSDKDPPAQNDIDRLLLGAATTIESVRYCWLISRADGSIRARPMGRILPSALQNKWTILFVTNRRSRKAADLRRFDAVTLIFQNDRDDAFVRLSGTARLIEAEQEVRALWNEEAYAKYFPAPEDRANVGFIEVKVTYLELWIRGVTPEPFGMRPTILERNSQSGWTLAPDGAGAPGHQS